ncbi:MAG: hypothetical protein MK060_08775 [Blastomonas sp.]|uniref:hypothetical protein n=1 Tax=unclassified Blastomonas TaxID=2626550 RepID=UPI0010F5A137|nr:hypothetical protein [Blastomonas sp.]MCH2237959.1 hypothetical protein [Blastomonas sp.]
MFGYVIHWEALATATAGLMAVVGAVFVGLRQVALTRRQIEIMHQQASDDRRLRQQNLKLSLLDRREPLLFKLQDISREYFQTGKISSEKKKELYDVLRKSQLLYPKDISDQILDVIYFHERKQTALNRQATYAGSGRLDEAMAAYDQSDEFDAKVFELLPKIIEKMREVSSMNDWD